MFTFITFVLLLVGLPQQIPTVTMRMANRSFPSVFQAWSRADNLTEDAEATIARHDLFLQVPEGFGLQWEGEYIGTAMVLRPPSIAFARARRARLLARNPNMIFFAEIRYRDAPLTYLPRNHRWWRRDVRERFIEGWDEGDFYQLDWSNPKFRAQVAAQAKAVVDTGIVDGIYLNWWDDDDPDRAALLKRVREAIGRDKLILVNSNANRAPKSAPYINGLYIQGCFVHDADLRCHAPETAKEWKHLADKLVWSENNLMPPRVSALETPFVNSRDELNRMRATTTLVLTHSEGYALFSDPNDLPTLDHLHDWYSLWDFKSLGKPTARMTKRRDGAFQREFTGGTVVYNPMGNKTVTVGFDRTRTSAATGKSSTTFTVSGMDGDLYLKQN